MIIQPLFSLQMGVMDIMYTKGFCKWLHDLADMMHTRHTAKMMNRVITQKIPSRLSSSSFFLSSFVEYTSPSSILSAINSSLPC